MDFKVLIAESAIADLKQIVEFVAEDNPEAAIRLGEKLLGHALSLATFPERFLSTTDDVESARCRYRFFLSITNAMNRLPL
jgi:plasmid stabilization system protein ParE